MKESEIDRSTRSRKSGTGYVDAVASRQYSRQLAESQRMHSLHRLYRAWCLVCLAAVVVVGWAVSR